MMKDIVLEWEGCEWNKWNAQVILPNIQGQRYVLGSSYPGERAGEEFLFCGNERLLIDSTHIVIRVDLQGQYWIQSDTTKFKTFVNSEILSVEPRLLGIGDIVSLEKSEIRDVYPRRRQVVFYIEERIVPGRVEIGSGCESDNDNEGDKSKSMKELHLIGGEVSPLEIPEILENLMSYLPVKELKKARQVCKKWNAEATKALERRGKVSVIFNKDYFLNPKNSTMVFRYLHEMGKMKMRNLLIHVNYHNTLLTSPLEKMLDDLRNLLKKSSHCSTLFLKIDIGEESGFLLFSTILQELGEKLVELELETYQLFLPASIIPFPAMRNLKKFTHCGPINKQIRQRWVSHFVPLFSNNLEHFITSSFHTADIYVQEFLKNRMPKLKGLAFKDHEIRPRTLSTLLELEAPLKSLEIHYRDACTDEYGNGDEKLFERLLLKHSKSLQHLVLRIGLTHIRNHYTEVVFPSFPKLTELEVEYGAGTRVGWGTEVSLNYEDHFPSLRRLTVRAKGSSWPPPPWGEVDHDHDQVFKAFFPEECGWEVPLRCETLKEVWIHPVRPNPILQPRMDQIRNMFPSAGKIVFFLTDWKFNGERCKVTLFFDNFLEFLYFIEWSKELCIQ